MNSILNLFFVLTLVVLTGCKDIKSSSLQKIVSSELNYELKTSCDIQNLNVSLLEDEDKNNYLCLKSNAEGLVRELRIDTLTNVSLNCGDESFQLLFEEQQGNSYQTTIHSFVKHPEFNFILNGTYIRISNRNGIRLLYKGLTSPVKIDEYNGMYLANSKEDVEIYDFSGFQEEKEPEISTYYDEIKTSRNNKEKLKVLSSEIVLNFLLDNIAISTDNLSDYNDIAYWLEQAELYREAIYLLEALLEEHPDRTVAYINIGDAYWGIKNIEDAKKVYIIYIEQMKAKGLENKIPQRIFDRVLT